MAQQKFLHPQNPGQKLRELKRHPGIYTNGSLVLGCGGEEIAKHALGKLFMNYRHPSDAPSWMPHHDFVSSFLWFWILQMKPLFPTVGIMVLTPDAVVGYDDAYTNVEDYARMQKVRATKMSMDQIIQDKDNVLSIVLLFPPLTAQNAEDAKREYDCCVSPKQSALIAQMREHGLLDCAFENGADDGVGDGLKIIPMKDPWPEIDINVNGVDKGKALSRFLQNKGVLKTLNLKHIDVRMHMAALVN